MPSALATGCHMLMVVRLLLLLLRLMPSACALPVPIRLHLLLCLSFSACAWLTLPFLLPLLLPLLLAAPALSRRFQLIWPAFLTLPLSVPVSKHALLLLMPIKVWA